MKNWIGTVAAGLTLSLGAVPEARAQIAYEVQTAENTAGLPYLMYLPPDHDPAAQWPVLVYLHGSGQIGTDLSALPVFGPTAVVEHPLWDWPFIVISPQSSGGSWSDYETQIGAILDRLETEFGADPNREYLSGNSYGGNGTWDLGAAMADRWAALMPLCPGGGGADPVLATKPIFAIHGDMDGSNPIDGTTNRIADLEAAGATFFEFVYPSSGERRDEFPLDVLTQTHVFGNMEGYGHNVWDVTYGMLFGQNPNILAREFVPKTVQYEWLLAQSLDGSPFVDPRPETPEEPDPVDAMGGAGGAGGDPAPAMGGAVAVSDSMAGAGAEPTPGDGETSQSETPVTPGADPLLGGPSQGGVDSESGGCSIGGRTATLGMWTLLGFAALGLARRRNRQ